MAAVQAAMTDPRDQALSELMSGRFHSSCILCCKSARLHDSQTGAHGAGTMLRPQAYIAAYGQNALCHISFSTLASFAYGVCKMRLHAAIGRRESENARKPLFYRLFPRLTRRRATRGDFGARCTVWAAQRITRAAAPWHFLYLLRAKSKDSTVDASHRGLDLSLASDYPPSRNPPSGSCLHSTRRLCTNKRRTRPNSLGTQPYVMIDARFSGGNLRKTRTRAEPTCLQRATILRVENPYLLGFLRRLRFAGFLLRM